jgi:hypothetical protein
VGWLSRGASGHRATDRLRPGLAAVALGAVLAVTAGACSGPPPLSARDRNWRQDIAYLARELPAVRHARLGPVTPAAWHAAAARLEAAVPRLTGGQIVAGMARLLASSGWQRGRWRRSRRTGTTGWSSTSVRTGAAILPRSSHSSMVSGPLPGSGRPAGSSA